jgi:FKBP-type peptidyl-prolyl cis-trans isomerase SlpA
MKKAKTNDTVKVHYKGTLSDGQVFDSSEGREPLQFKLGSGQVITGFDKNVEGMEVNEEKTIKIPANEAYGEIKNELIQEVPKKHIPEDLKPEVGMKLVSKTPDGHEIPLVVTEIKEESIVVDANHPLAGHELTFEVKLIEIE